MFRFSAGFLPPHAAVIIGLNRVSPLRRHGYSGEYFANTPSTGREGAASEIRVPSLTSRKLAVTLAELAPTVNVRRSWVCWSTTVRLVTARLSRTASRSSAAEE